ncbi:hypothetical protein [Arsenophonus sp.]|uniref:hypothetical protein n=1 Tax=Arsenophonus sp. TaxID=1872640 RepID=UPI003879ECFD
MASNILVYFTYQHFAENEQIHAKAIYQLAKRIDDDLPDSAEKSAGLRKLLEAKDCFARANRDKFKTCCD